MTAALARPTPAATKIIVHGLPADVTERQIREYMTTEVGPVSRIELAYDKNGASKGVVTVQFAKDGEYALKAANLLNGRVVDGRGKMRVEIVQSVKEPGLAERMSGQVKPAKAVQGAVQEAVQGADAEAFARAVSAATSGATLTKKEKSVLRKAAAAAGAPTTQKKPAPATVTAAKAAGVKTKKLAKAGPGRVKRVAKTAAELDAEMTDYFEKSK